MTIHEAVPGDTMPEPDKLICQVCNTNEALGVASSCLGPISFAFCRECLTNHAEPLWLVKFQIEECGGLEQTAE